VKVRILQHNKSAKFVPYSTPSLLNELNQGLDSTLPYKYVQLKSFISTVIYYVKSVQYMLEIIKETYLFFFS
jgi:hypothetical protein